MLAVTDINLAGNWPKLCHLCEHEGYNLSCVHNTVTCRRGRLETDVLRSRCLGC